MSEGKVTIHLAMSECRNCNIRFLTKGSGPTEAYARSFTKHADYHRKAHACLITEMVLLHTSAHAVDFHGSAHEICPKCQDDHVHVREYGDMVAMECQCSHIWVACKLCLSPMVHPNHDFVFTCSGCNYVVDYSKRTLN